jgi:hypothetical protein
MKVWCEEDRPARRGFEGADVDPVASKRGGKDLTVDVELTWIRGVSRDLLSNLRARTGAVPVKVKRDENLKQVRKLFNGSV